MSLMKICNRVEACQIVKNILNCRLVVLVLESTCIMTSYLCKRKRSANEVSNVVTNQVLQKYMTHKPGVKINSYRHLVSVLCVCVRRCRLKTLYQSSPIALTICVGRGPEWRAQHSVWGGHRQMFGCDPAEVGLDQRGVEPSLEGRVHVGEGHDVLGLLQDGVLGGGGTRCAQGPEVWGHRVVG